MAQRLNKKLVVGLTVAGMLIIAVAGILIVYSLPGRDPIQMLNKAEAFAAAKEYEDAGKYYALAAKRAMSAGKPADANDYMVKAGEMVLNAGDPTAALKCWESVILNNPQHEAAQQKTVELRTEQAQAYGRQLWLEVKKEAEKLCQITNNANLIGLHALGRATIESSTGQPTEIKKGRELLEKAFQKDPTNPKFAESLASAYLQLFNQAKEEARQKGRDLISLEGARDEAIAQASAIYDTLLKNIDKAGIKDASVITTALRKQGQFHLIAREGASIDYRTKLSKGASSSELASIAAKIEKHSAQALSSFQKAMRNSPEDDETLVLLGAYWRSLPSLSPDPDVNSKEVQANQTKAEVEFKRAIKANPDSFDPYLQLADIYLREGEAAFAKKLRSEMVDDLGKANQVLEQRISRGTARSGVLEWRNRSYMAIVRWQLFQVNAVLLERLQQFPGQQATENETKPLLERMRQIRKDFVADTTAGEKDNRAMFMKARLHIFDNQPFPAITILRELQNQLPPGDLWTRTRMYLAQLCLQIDEPGPAITALQEVIQVNPNMTSAMGQLARALSMMPDRQAEAEDMAKRVLTADSNNREALVALYNVYQKQKNWKAIEKIQTALGGSTTSTASKLQSANILIAQAADSENKEPDAIVNAHGIIHEVLKEDPSNIQAIRMLQVSTPTTDKDKLNELTGVIARAKADVDAKLKAASASTQPAEQSIKALHQTKSTLEVLSLVAQPDLPEAERIKQTEAIIRQESDQFLVNIDLYRMYLGIDGRQADAVRYLKEAYKLRADDARVVEMLFRVSISELKDSKGTVIVKPDWDLANQLIKKTVSLGIDRSEGHYYQGQLLFARTDLKDNFAQAEREFREGLKVFPMHSAGYSWLGRALLAQQRTDDALGAFQQAFQLNPRNAMASMYLAMIADQGQDEENKQKYLQICKTLNVTNPWVMQQLQILQDRQDPAKGIARREEMRKQKPADFNNLSQLATLYIDSGNLDKAKELMAACYQLQPKNLWFLNQYAMFLRGLTPPECDQAEAIIRKTLDSLDPNDKNQRAAAQLVQAVHMRDMYERKLPKAPTEEAVDAVYLAAGSMSNQPTIVLEIANHFLKKGNLAKTEEFMRKAIANAESTSDASSEQSARKQLISLLLRVKDPKRSSDILKEIQAYRTKFNDSTALAFLSEYATMIGRESQAIGYATQFIVATSGNEKALGYYRRAGMNYRRGEWDLAIADLRESKTLAPRLFEHEHRILLARCLHITGQFDQAEAELTSILNENSRNLRAADEVYRMYMAAKKYDQAEAFLMPAYNLDPKSPQWIGMLTEVAAARGDRNKAVERAILTVENSDYAPNLIDNLLAIMMQFKRYDDLIEYVGKKLPEKNRNDPAVLVRLSAAHFANGNKAGATEAFGRALKINQTLPGRISPVVLDLPKSLGVQDAVAFMTEMESAYSADPASTVALALVLQRTGNKDGFIKTAEALLPKLPKNDPKLVPMRVEILHGLVEASSDRKEIDKSCKIYEEILALAPPTSTAYSIALNNLAYLLTEDLNQPAAGLKYAEQAHQLVPNQPNIMDTLGWSLILTGQYDRGIALTRAAGLAGAFDAIQFSAIQYHSAYGLFKRSQQLRQRNQATDADQDLSEAKLACRQAHQMLKSIKTDNNDLQTKIVSLGKELGLTLETLPPAGQGPTTRP